MLDPAWKQVRGIKRTSRDPARARELFRKLRADFERDGRFKGMTDDQMLRKFRQTREEVWNEIKNAPVHRHV